VVISEDTAQYGVLHDGTEVTGKPKEVSVYAVKSYAHVMCSASHGGGVQMLGSMVSAWRTWESCCHDGLHSSYPLHNCHIGVELFAYKIHRPNHGTRHVHQC